MKTFVEKIPVIGPGLKALKNAIVPRKGFSSSKQYWVDRYAKGGNSGPGSYNNLAEFKSEIINAFIEEHNIRTAIELGCGDGNQLKLLKIPTYTGYDVSPDAIQQCRDTFKNDLNKTFHLISELGDHSAELTMSLDVLFHLVEEDIFHLYLSQLFDASDKYVIIYAYDFDDDGSFAPHVKPRKFTPWIKEHKPEFKLLEHIPNKYPFIPGKGESTSLSEFFIYEKQAE